MTNDSSKRINRILIEAKDNNGITHDSDLKVNPNEGIGIHTGEDIDPLTESLKLWLLFMSLVILIGIIDLLLFQSSIIFEFTDCCPVIGDDDELIADDVR